MFKRFFSSDTPNCASQFPNVNFELSGSSSDPNCDQ